MMRFTAGEWRYALLLIPLLVLAAVASVTMVSYVETLFVEFEEQHAYRQLDNQLAFEKSRLQELARFTARSAPPAADQYDAYLDRVVRAEQLEQFNLVKIAIVDHAGAILSMRLMPGQADDLEMQAGFLAWTNIMPAVSASLDSWVGFARAHSGLVLLALARMPGAEEVRPEEATFLALVRPFDHALIQRIRQNYPDFLGPATPSYIKAPDTHLVPVRDVSGRQVGAFVFSFNPSRIEAAVEGFRWAVLALTMGMLFLAGSLGLWAIRSTTEIESLKRVGRFVDTMDYLHDGLVAVDKKGRVTGCNPSARAMAGRKPQPHDGIRELFPMLNDGELKTLSSSRPREVEKPLKAAYGRRIWRFRSQPSEGFNLLLISDVTDEKTQEMRQRQVATLQMIGRVARGVAHDFNNILCAISGHAALLGMPASLGEDDRASLKAINQESERGAALAAHLLELSRVRQQDEPADRLEEHVEKAAGLLRVGLSSSWQVITDAETGFPTVTLSAIQIEQVVLNLGLLVADELGTPGIVRLSVHRPTPRDPLLDIEDIFAAVILIAAHRSGDSDAYRVSDSPPHTTAEEAGVIQSVARTMLEEVSGRLDVLFTAEGRHSYRVCLPGFGAAKTGAPRVPEEWVTYIGHWKVLLALPQGEQIAQLKTHLESMGTSVEVAEDLVGALSRVDKEQAYTAMVFDREILGAEAEVDGLLRAILKLQPSAGLVVLFRGTDTILSSLTSEAVFVSREAGVEAVSEAMIKAREMVAQRKRHA
ncbi:MAG: hypothetical protein JXB04_00130 [Kiritimatiellae bacterium]|nr:hypothetical protein [Kiritimatiellia bacterium]